VGDVAGVTQSPSGVEQGPADRGSAVGEHDQVHALGPAVGKLQQRSAALFDQAGDARPGA